MTSKCEFEKRHKRILKMIDKEIDAWLKKYEEELQK